MADRDEFFALLRQDEGVEFLEDGFAALVAKVIINDMQQQFSATG